jgi:type II secretory pathway component GspD/PulD (secretin)
MEIQTVTHQTHSPVGIYTVPGSARVRSIGLAAAMVLAVGLAQPTFAQDATKETKEEQAKQQASEAESAAVRAKAQAQFQQSGATGAATPAGAAGAAGRGTQGQPGTGAATPPRTPGSPVPGLKVEGDGANGANGVTGGVQPGPDEVTLSAFSEAVELKTLVDYVAEALQINVSASDELTGSIVLNAPVTVKKSELLKLLDSLLEQQGFTIVQDPETGWYKVIRDTSTTFAPGSTTRVFPTPTIKPSSLVTALNEQIGVQNRPQRISYMDELGVIVATDTPRRLDALAEFIKTVLMRSKESQFIRFELDHVAASTARQRVIELLGQPATTGGVALPQQGGNPQALAAMIGQPGNIINLADRLSIDPAGNALIFRGYPDEQDKLRNLLAIIDRVNTLRYEQYSAGSACLQIAQLAERLGLGHVEIVDTGTQQTPTTGAQPVQQQQQQGRGGANQFQQPAQQQATASQGGPVMIVDTYRNNIIYYGTDSQHLQLADLIGKFDTQGEQIVIVTYKLKNKPSTDIADILNGVAFNQSTGGSTSSLPGAGGGFFLNNFGAAQNQNNRRTTGSTTSRTNNSRINNSFTNNEQNQLGFRFQPGQAQSTSGNVNQNDPLGGNDVFILADQPNNQIIVKAPLRQQEEFSSLIGKLDQRSPRSTSR